MSAPDFVQIVDTLDLGVLVLDTGYRILYWNKWMERATGRPAAEVVGHTLGDVYPAVLTKAFIRNFRSVVSFGIVAVFSPRLHGQLFPIPAASESTGGRDLMPQRCVLGPLREEGEITSAYLTVEDVSDSWMQERMLGDLAMRDGLTGVFNRRYFDRRLEEEFERAGRYGHPLSLIMLDIDFFKQVNDLHGHQFGDEALRDVALSCQECLRVTDLIARYGGEEFCVLLPETALHDARFLAERLRASVERRPVAALGRRQAVSVSAGVSVLRPGEGVAALVERADAALYRAKAGGRNRVEVEG